MSQQGFEYRQEGKGSTEIPRVLKDKKLRALAEAMKVNGWTFEESKHIRCYAPYWVPGGINYIGMAKTPSDVNAWRPGRTRYRQWCQQVGLEPNF